MMRSGPVRKIGQFEATYLCLNYGPLTGQLPNRQNISTITLLLKSDEASVPDGIQRATRGCGCGQPVASGRKFVNQQHYDRSKGLWAAEMEELLARYGQGLSKHQLARDFGVAPRTVKKAIKRA
jgi:hypothetical protein